jgi:hypothetical protein
VIQFSAEVGNSEVGDEVSVAFAIGGAAVGAGACNTSGGPESFHHAAHTFFETKTTIHVRTIGTGTKTVKACYRLADNGNSTGSALLWQRSLTVECRTQ